MANSGYESGANVATQAGEGKAGVWHWEGYYNTINQIHQNQLAQGVEYKKVMDRSAIALEGAQKGVRAADVPRVQELYGQWKEASLMQQSPKIQKDPVARAQYMHKADNAYAELMSLTDDSKTQVKFENALNVGAAAKGFVGYVPAADYAKIQQLSSTLPISEIHKRGLSTALPYMLPAATMPKEDLQTAAIGKRLPEVKKYTDVYDGKVKIGQRESQVTRYEFSGDPNTILHNTARYLANIPMAKADADRTFKTDLEKNGQEWMEGIIGDAQKEVDQHPIGGHAPAITYDPVGYEQARRILEAKEKTEDTGKFIPDAEYMKKQTLDAQKAKTAADHLFDLQKLRISHNNRMSEKAYGVSLTKSTLPANYNVDDIELGLRFPSMTTKAEPGQQPKSNMELVMGAMAHLNAATKKTQSGIEMQPLPVFTGASVANNEVYQRTIKQTMEKLRSVLGKDAAALLDQKLQSGQPHEKLQALANAYNKINSDNGISARFTAEDLQKSMPVIVMEHNITKPLEKGITHNEANYNGILKPGTPEFRNKIQFQIDQYGKSLKKGMSSVKVVGQIADMNSQLDDGDE